MATLTLKNIPDELHRLLKERAMRNRRSLNSEVLHCLEEAVMPPARDPEALLARVDAFREKLAARGVWVTPEAIQEAIEEGRS